MKFRVPELLGIQHEVEEFDCGSAGLNSYLKRYALSNNAAGSARTYVSCKGEGGLVIGYYSLCAGSVEKASVAERIGKGMPAHPVPIVLLARLAVDLKHRGQGVGQGLLKDALLRCLTASDCVGIRAVLVHAKDARAAEYYSRFGFARSPTDPLHLMLLIKDIKNSL